MFENVPEKLKHFVRQIAQKETNRDFAYLRAAMSVAVEYANLNLQNRDAIEYFKIAPDGKIPYDGACRILAIGETLFNLRSTGCFPELCRRLKSRSIRSAFVELLGARTFFEGGFQVFARPEIGVKGEDFDFYGIKDEERANAEVTTLTALNFSMKTALNALHQKRKTAPQERSRLRNILFDSNILGFSCAIA